MGKKSRLKKQIKAGELSQKLPAKANKMARSSGWENFFLWLIYLSSAAALFSPFILSGRFYFPFVGPKGLFIMACCEVAFFAWLILILTIKKYRPRLNAVLVAFALLILILFLSTVLGSDPSRSFWSKFERMTGLVMWLHIFGLFLALSNSLKSKTAWKNLLGLSVTIGITISLMALLEQAGVQSFDFSHRSGSTLGNSSFLGTYLLFNVFFAAYLFFFSDKVWQKIVFASSLVLALAAIYFSHARAATWASIGGLLLMAVLFLSFKIPQKKVRLISRIALTIGCLVVLAAVVMLFIPGNPVSDKFTAIATKSRTVNWVMAWKGFLEKPILGWGPENYSLIFPKYFNPCLFTPECGGEVWFDRTHNIVLDTLITSGILGLVAYLGLFVVLIICLARQKSKDFWAFSAITSLLVAYFIQNLSVFDMPVSLLLFTVVLAFGSFIFGQRNQTDNQEFALPIKQKWPTMIVAIIFLSVFSYCVIQPARTDNFTLRAVQAQDLSQRLEYAQKALDVSPAGRYQIRDFFAEQFSGDIQRNLKDIMNNQGARQGAEKLLNFSIAQLGKSIQQSPMDYSATLKLAQAYNIYAYLDFSKNELAEKYGQDTVALSPTNPQGYWVLAQTQLYLGKFDEALAAAQKAVDLEPKWFTSWAIAIQVAQRSNNQEKAKQLTQQALDVALLAIEKNPDNLSYYQYAANFANELGDTNKARAIAQQAINHNPEWQKDLAGFLPSTSTNATSSEGLTNPK